MNSQSKGFEAFVVIIKNGFLQYGLGKMFFIVCVNG
jgi:hypothetical protein